MLFPSFSDENFLVFQSITEKLIDFKWIVIFSETSEFLLKTVTYKRKIWNCEDIGWQSEIFLIKAGILMFKILRNKKIC